MSKPSDSERRRRVHEEIERCALLLLDHTNELERIFEEEPMLQRYAIAVRDAEERLAVPALLERSRATARTYGSADLVAAPRSRALALTFATLAHLVAAPAWTYCEHREVGAYRRAPGVLLEERTILHVPLRRVSCEQCLARYELEHDQQLRRDRACDVCELDAPLLSRCELPLGAALVVFWIGDCCHDLLHVAIDAPTRLRVAADGRVAAVGRNAPCPCGSGRKFKHCCLDSVQRRIS